MICHTRTLYMFILQLYAEPCTVPAHGFQCTGMKNALFGQEYGCVCLIAVLNPRYNTAVLYHPFFPCILNCTIETPIRVKGLL